jgi:hypothetical protein
LDNLFHSATCYKVDVGWRCSEHCAVQQYLDSEGMGDMGRSKRWRRRHRKEEAMSAQGRAMTKELLTVPIEASCPQCHEQDMDELQFIDEAKVRCLSCKHEYFVMDETVTNLGMDHIAKAGAVDGAAAEVAAATDAPVQTKDDALTYDMW